jgi:hypothetical protein
VFKPLLDAHPIIESLEFTAYTPYFMDGDECIYSVGDLGATLVDIDVDYPPEFFESYSDSYGQTLALLRDGTVPTSSWMPKGVDDYESYFRKNNAGLIELGIEKLEEIVAAREAGQDYVRLLAGIPDDVIRDMFGDHVKVTITREGVTVDQYDHD